MRPTRAADTWGTIRAAVRAGLLGLVILTWATAPRAQEEASMQLSSAAFAKGALIPKPYTCDGADRSPALSWTDPPEGTRSFALICDDPDAPVGTWVHWVLYQLPGDTRELPEGVATDEELPSGARQGANDFRRVGYGGPCPPPGPAHRYFFTLYALDAPVDLPPRATKQQLLEAIGGHILGTAQLMGRYQR